MQTTIAIDPGSAGGIAYRLPGQQAQCRSMPESQPDIYFVLERIKQESNGSPIVCAIEQLPKFIGGNAGEGSIPGFSIAVMFENYGFCLGVLQALKISCIVVTPQKWQKDLGLGNTGRQRAPKGASADEKKSIRLANGKAKRDWKNKLKAEAQRRFPHLAATLKTGDALLILEWLARQTNLLRVAAQSDQPTQSDLLAQSFGGMP